MVPVPTASAADIATTQAQQAAAVPFPASESPIQTTQQLDQFSTPQQQAAHVSGTPTAPTQNIAPDAVVPGHQAAVAAAATPAPAPTTPIEAEQSQGLTSASSPSLGPHHGYARAAGCNGKGSCDAACKSARTM